MLARQARPQKRKDRPKYLWAVLILTFHQANSVKHCALLTGLSPTSASFYNCWIPASTQPVLPLSGFDIFHTSENGSAAAPGAERIWPVNFTLAR